MFIQLGDDTKMEDKDIDSLFFESVEKGNNMPTQTADNMLRAYAYYKQATVGDCNEPMPDSMNMVATFKYNSWRSLYGMDVKEAKLRYIEFIAWLQKEGER